MKKQAVDVSFLQPQKEIVEVVQHAPKELVMNRARKQIVAIPCAADHGGWRGRWVVHTTRARAEAYDGADRGNARSPASRRTP